MGFLELRQLVFVLTLLMSFYSLCDTLRILLSRGLAHNGTTLGVSNNREIENESHMHIFVCMLGTHMLSPAVPYLIILINWIMYCYWSDINQTHLSLYLMVFAIPLVKLNVNLVVSAYAIL